MAVLEPKLRRLALTSILQMSEGVVDGLSVVLWIVAVYKSMIRNYKKKKAMFSQCNSKV